MTNTPEFTEGQEVTIRRTLGISNTRYKGRYYHGSTLDDVPLGTKGIVKAVHSQEEISVRFANGKLMYVHPGELYSKEELNEMRKPDESKVASLLEKSLMEGEGRHTPKMPEIEGRIDSYFVSLVNGEVIVTRYKDGRQKIYSQDEHKFEPSFNVREEFAIWMREEFPQLGEHILSGEIYTALEDRRDEVYNAALKACQHGIDTTLFCMQGAFRYHLKDLNRYKGTNRFNLVLRTLIDTIVSASANLNDENDRHYATNIRRKM